MTKRHPTPWRTSTEYLSRERKAKTGNLDIWDAKGNWIGCLRKPLANRIVRCMNIHGALVDALNGLLAHRECPIYSPEGKNAHSVLTRARRA